MARVPAKIPFFRVKTGAALFAGHALRIPANQIKSEAKPLVILELCISHSHASPYTDKKSNKSKVDTMSSPLRSPVQVVGAGNVQLPSSIEAAAS